MLIVILLLAFSFTWNYGDTYNIIQTFLQSLPLESEGNHTFTIKGGYKVLTGKVYQTFKAFSY